MEDDASREDDDVSREDDGVSRKDAQCILMWMVVLITL